MQKHKLLEVCIVKCLLIAYFIGNIYAKKYQLSYRHCGRKLISSMPQNSFMCVKVIASQRWDVFWDTVYLCYGMPSKSRLASSRPRPRPILDLQDQDQDSEVQDQGQDLDLQNQDRDRDRDRDFNIWVSRRLQTKTQVSKLHHWPSLSKYKCICYLNSALQHYKIGRYQKSTMTLGEVQKPKPFTHKHLCAI